MGESAHYFFHMGTQETRWVAPGEEEEEEEEDAAGPEGQEEQGQEDGAAAQGVGFGHVSGTEGEWAIQYGGKAFPAGAWAALGDSSAPAPLYLDPEVPSAPQSATGKRKLSTLVVFEAAPAAWKFVEGY